MAGTAEAVTEQAANAATNGAGVDTVKTPVLGDMGQGMMAFGVAVYATMVAVAKFQKVWNARS